METIKPDKRIERLGSEEDDKRHKLLAMKRGDTRHLEEDKVRQYLVSLAGTRSGADGSLKKVFCQLVQQGMRILYTLETCFQQHLKQSQPFGLR